MASPDSLRQPSRRVPLKPTLMARAIELGVVGLWCRVEFRVETASAGVFD